MAGGVKMASPVIGSLACQLEVCCTYVIRLLRARADVIIHAFVHSNSGSSLATHQINRAIRSPKTASLWHTAVVGSGLN